MIDLAEQNRKSENVEFVLYDGLQFPVLLRPFDLVLSVGVLQTMRGESLKKAVSQLAQYLQHGGQMLLIEQASDNPGVERPRLQEYLEAFEVAGLTCLWHYPIRNGRWWLLYLIRYGVIPKGWFSQIAKWELKKSRKRKGRVSYYMDFLFLTKKG